MTLYIQGSVLLLFGVNAKGENIDIELGSGALGELKVRFCCFYTTASEVTAPLINPLTFPPPEG